MQNEGSGQLSGMRQLNLYLPPSKQMRAVSSRGLEASYRMSLSVWMCVGGCAF